MSRAGTARTCLRLAMVASFLAAGLLLAACGSQLGSPSTLGSSLARPSGPVGQLLAVSCPSSDVCFATGQVTIERTTQSSVDNYSPPGVIMKTTDGGRSWSRETLPAEAGPISGIVCWTVAHCLAVGSKVWHAQIETSAPGALVVGTTDGGRHWRALATPEGVRDLLSVACPSTTLCIAAGADALDGMPEGGGILVSTDAGVRWRLAMRSKGDTLGGVSCPSVRSCVVIDTMSALVFASSDGGQHWLSSSVLQNSQIQPETITCTRADHCLITGFADEGYVTYFRVAIVSLSPHALRLATVPSLRVINLQAIACPTSRRCVAVGLGPNPSALAATSGDAGLHWRASTGLARNYALEAVSCPDTRRCVAVGFSVYMPSSAVILYTNDFGAHWNKASM